MGNKYSLDSATIEMLNRAEYRMGELRRRAEQSDNKEDTTCGFYDASDKEHPTCQALDRFYCRIEKCRFYKTKEEVAAQKEADKKREAEKKNAQTA